jgi:hypothetical protein
MRDPSGRRRSPGLGAGRRLHLRRAERGGARPRACPVPQGGMGGLAGRQRGDGASPTRSSIRRSGGVGFRGRTHALFDRGSRVLVLRDDDPPVSGSYQAARSRVDVAVTAADRLLARERATYGLCRPPGHHSPRAAFGGYCFFNFAAIAASTWSGVPDSRCPSWTWITTTGRHTANLLLLRGRAVCVSSP